MYKPYSEITDYRRDLLDQPLNLSVPTRRLRDHLVRRLHDYTLTVGTATQDLRLHSSDKLRFRHETGTTPKAFIDMNRMASAKLAIQETSANLSSICFAVGYNGYSSFRKACHRIEGVAPSKIFVGIFVLFSLLWSGA